MSASSRPARRRRQYVGGCDGPCRPRPSGRCGEDTTDTEYRLLTCSHGTVSRETFVEQITSFSPGSARPGRRSQRVGSFCLERGTMSPSLSMTPRTVGTMRSGANRVHALFLRAYRSWPLAGADTGTCTMCSRDSGRRARPVRRALRVVTRRPRSPGRGGSSPCGWPRCCSPAAECVCSARTARTPANG